MECLSLTDEELMKKFAKYKVESMLKRKNKDVNETVIKEYIVHSGKKLDFITGDYEFQLNNRILFDLMILSGDPNCNDKHLKSWYDFKRYELISLEMESTTGMSDYERKLNDLLKLELDKLGIPNKYSEERKYVKVPVPAYKKAYHNWLKEIGYEKSLIIWID